MSRLRWTDFSGGLWIAGPSDDNPERTLRQAKGVAPLRSIALRSRSGTLQFFNVNAHSITRYNDEYIMGVGSGLYKSASRAIASETLIPSSGVFDGTRLTFVQMPPTTKALDTAGVADRLFVAGGGELRKVDPAFAAGGGGPSAPSAPEEWGIAPPSYGSFAAAAATQNSVQIDNLNAIGDATAWVTGDTLSPSAGDSYTLSDDANRNVQGGSSMRLAVGKNGDFVAQSTLGAALDFTDITDLTGTQTGTSSIEDYISFAVRINRPKHVKSVEVSFDVDTSGDLFNEAKTYSRELKVKIVRKKKKRELFGTGDIIRRKDEKKFLQQKKDLPRDLSQQEFIAEDTIAVVRRRWTRVTIPKATFESGGGAEYADWANVRGIRFTVETNRQGIAKVNFDDLRLIGGVGMQGDYQYHVTFLNSVTGTRSNPDLTTGPIAVRNIERQGVSLSNIPQSGDDQADKIEIWRTIGNGELFFKALELNDGTTSTTDNVADYSGMFDKISAPNSTNTAILDPDEELPLDNTKPEDTYEDCAGPHLARMWWTRDSATGKKGRVYYSPVGRAEAVQGFIDPASDEDPAQKLVIWNQQLWLFTTLHVYRILGTTEPFTFTEVWGAPGTDEPFSVQPSPAGIIYKAEDGIRILKNGTDSVLVGESDPLAPVFRGGTTDGINSFTGQLAAYGRTEYYITDPSTSNGSATGTTLAVNVTTGAWRNLGHPFNSLFYDVKDNRLLGSPVSAMYRSVWYTRDNDANVVFSVSNSGPYVRIGPGESSFSSATLAQMQLRLVRAVNIRSLHVHINTTLTGSNQVDVFFNVNGGQDTTINATLTAGEIRGSATGLLALSQDDLLCIEGSFSGGITGADFLQITVGYDMAPE